MTIEGRSLNDPALAGWLGAGRKSSAGATVTEHQALSLSAVFAAVNLLSRIVGSLPLNVYRRVGAAKSPALSHPAFSVLHTRPNPEMTASVFRRTLEWNRLLFGKACAEIQWDGGGNVRAVWPLQGWRVFPRRDGLDGPLYYLVDGERRVSPEDMIYVPLVSEDGVSGRSFLDYAVESLGLSITAQEFAAHFFGNGARPGGILKHPGTPKAEARKEMRESWTREHGGAQKTARVGVIWGGWEWVEGGGTIPPDQAQLLETRRFSTEEVSRWLNIPPSFLADLSRATFGNIEEQGINFVVYCLALILVEYEQEFDSKLLQPPALFSKHNMGALLRGNMAARAAFFTALFNIGVLSPNDMREMEDLNPIPGGDEYFVPLNMTLLSQAAEDPGTQETPPVPEPDTPPEPSPQPGPGNSGLSRQMQLAAYARMLRVETNAVRRAAKRPGEFLTWLDSFYPAHEAKLAEAIADEGLAAKHCQASREDLLDLTGKVSASQLTPVLFERMTQWEFERNPT